MKHYITLQSGMDVLTHKCGNSSTLVLSCNRTSEEIALLPNEVRELWHVFSTWLKEKHPDVWAREIHKPDTESLKCGIRLMFFDARDRGKCVALLGYNERVAIALEAAHAHQVIEALADWLRHEHPKTYLKWKIMEDLDKVPVNHLHCHDCAKHQIFAMDKPIEGWEIAYGCQLCTSCMLKREGGNGSAQTKGGQE